MCAHACASTIHSAFGPDSVRAHIVLSAYPSASDHMLASATRSTMGHGTPNPLSHREDQMIPCATRFVRSSRAKMFAKWRQHAALTSMKKEQSANMTLSGYLLTL